MKLYYSPGTCALADHIALEWIGKPYEVRRLSKEDRQTPEYLAINPAGAVPALDDDGWILTQNVAILNYLADLHPESMLGGDGTPKGRAEVNRWLSFANSDVHPLFKPFFGSVAFLEDKAAIDKVQDNARKSLRTLFERADQRLADREWIAGTRSIADPYLFVVLRWARAVKIDLSGLDNLHDFFARMRKDPGVDRALETEGLA